MYFHTTLSSLKKKRMEKKASSSINNIVYAGNKTINFYSLQCVKYYDSLSACGFKVITIAPTIANSNMIDVIINHIE